VVAIDDSNCMVYNAWYINNIEIDKQKCIILGRPLEKSQVCFPVYQLTMYNIDVIIYTVINNYQGRNCGFETEEAVENWDLTAQNNAL
jgi:hypothetical protein